MLELKMYKATGIVLVLLLTGCDSPMSEEYYLSNIDDAKEILKECKANQEKGIRLDSSEDCVNAFSAIRSDRVAKAKEESRIRQERHIAERQANKDKLKMEFDAFISDYKSLTDDVLYKAMKKWKCKDVTQCTALKKVFAEREQERIKTLINEINGDRAELQSSTERYKRACSGITKNDFKCRTIDHADDQLRDITHNKHTEMIEYYLDNRETIQSAYTECHGIIMDLFKRKRKGMTYVGKDAIMEAAFGFVPDDVHIKCNSLNDALRSLEITLDNGFKMSPSAFEELIH